MLHRGGGIGHSIQTAPAGANDVAPNLLKRAGYRPTSSREPATDADEHGDAPEEEHYEDQWLEQAIDEDEDVPEEYADTDPDPRPEHRFGTG